MNIAVLSQGLLSMIVAEKLATPLEVKLATCSCATNTGNRERAEWAHIACWGSQSELSVPFILPSHKYGTTKTSCANSLAIEQVNFSNIKFRLSLEMLACRNCLSSVS